MPAIYKIQCCECGFSVRGSTSLTVVVMKDGSEQICMHPIEKLDAERLTGEKWASLLRSGRIGCKFALFCRDCGALDYYGYHQNVNWTYMGSTVTRSPEVAEAHKCRSCGRNRLFPITWKRKEKVLCPNCKTGLLSSDSIGIS